MVWQVRIGIILSCIGTVMLIDSDVPLPYILTGWAPKLAILGGWILFRFFRKKRWGV